MKLIHVTLCNKIYEKLLIYLLGFTGLAPPLCSRLQLMKIYCIIKYLKKLIIVNIL